MNGASERGKMDWAGSRTKGKGRVSPSGWIVGEFGICEEIITTGSGRRWNGRILSKVEDLQFDRSGTKTGYVVHQRRQHFDQYLVRVSYLIANLHLFVIFFSLAKVSSSSLTRFHRYLLAFNHSRMSSLSLFSQSAEA